MKKPTDDSSQNASNPDRPPVTPENPDAPDPFDPFKTAAIADGGAVAQPTEEITFQNHLNDALQPQTPTTPQSPPTPDNSTQPVTTPKPEPVERTPPSEQEPYDGSLIQAIDNTRDGIETGWTYHVHELDTDTTLEHAVTDPDNNTQYTLRRNGRTYYVYPGSTKPDDLESSDEPNAYESFETALAALIEGLDWGTLPVQDPNIWTYTGYNDNNQTFPEYLSGSNNTECGDHYFGNTSAGYGVHIASHQDPNNPRKTVTVLTITDHEAIGEGQPVYRERFSGQNHAFTAFLGLINEQLSHTVYSHDNHTGPIEAIQTIKEIIQ